MAQYLIDDADLLKITTKAFKAGIDWAECYSTWFDPSLANTEKRLRTCVGGIKRSIAKNKIEE